jgi:FKBP-type peptidyl-prolyl cis-trans isomerase
LLSDGGSPGQRDREVVVSSLWRFRSWAFAAVLVAVALAPTRGAGDDPEPPQRVVKTRTGLKYRDVKAGKGDAAKKGDRLTVHYTGWLCKGGKKGKQFDSSHDRKQPFTFDLGKGQVIAGWEEGLQGVKAGGKRVLIIPAALAYGKRGVGDVIPPDSDLIFEVEVVSIGR